MEQFTKLTAAAAPMNAANVDTDVIMPKAFLKRIDKEGVLEGLFHDLRLRPDGSENPDFVLNQMPYREAQILLTGPNFGCGSSREHAVWGLKARGIRALIGSSFAGIFFDNCANNGLAVIVLPEADINNIASAVRLSEDKRLSVDLEAQTVTDPSGRVYRFEIDSSRKERLLNGEDPVTQTLKEEDKILAFEEKYFQQYPWLRPE